jgi:hypothetical protein
MSTMGKEALTAYRPIGVCLSLCYGLSSKQSTGTAPLVYAPLVHLTLVLL